MPSAVTTFPVPENQSDSAVNNSASVFPNPKKLIFILSKESDTRFLFKTLLEMWNYLVETAENTESLIAAAKASPASLVLMDTTLPFDENMTEMQRIKENEKLREVPIVLISGHSQPHIRNLAISLGANDFLVKPVDFDLLEDCLKRNIGKTDGKDL